MNYKTKLEIHILLKKALVYVSNNNKSSYLPYHNILHLLSVFDTALEISNTLLIEDNEKVELGVACLFHDMNHSGGVGRLPDIDNINIAIDCFKLFFKENESYFDDISMQNIIELIKCTEFPKKHEAISLTQQCIMDADILQCYRQDWFIIVCGLSTELNIPIKTMLNQQKTFIDNLTFYTEYAQKYHNSNKEKILIEVKHLIDVFEINE